MAREHDTGERPQITARAAAREVLRACALDAPGALLCHYLAYALTCDAEVARKLRLHPLVQAICADQVPDGAP